MQSDGKVIVGGIFTTFNSIPINYIVRTTTTWLIDNSFNAGWYTPNIVRATTLLSDGSSIVVWDFSDYSGSVRNRIFKLNASGWLDTSFVWWTDSNSLRATIKQPDGKVIIAGFFTTYNGTSINSIARISSTWSLDASFNPGGGPNTLIYTIGLQSNGKIIIGWAFSSYSGTTSNRITRLNSNWSLDSSFISSGVSNAVNTIAIQSDDKIIAGGSFTFYGSINRNNIVRLMASGWLDTSFSHTGWWANGTVNSIAIQSDGKIIIGWAFTSYNGTARNRIARINTDGTIDTSFNPGAGFNGVVNSIIVQTNGKIVVGGAFSTYNGSSRTRIARLNSDGSLDTFFTVWSWSDQIIYTTWGPLDYGVIYSITEQADNNLIIAWWFTRYNLVRKNFVARIFWGIGQCLDGIGTTIFSSFGFCLQSAWRDANVVITNAITNATLANHVISTPGVYRLPFRVAPTSSTSTGTVARYVGVPVSIPSMSEGTINSGAIFIQTFKAIQIATGGNIIPQY
jgi:uncharacterized delta-60 repeat protein